VLHAPLGACRGIVALDSAQLPHLLESAERILERHRDGPWASGEEGPDIGRDGVDKGRGHVRPLVVGVGLTTGDDPLSKSPEDRDATPVPLSKAVDDRVAITGEVHIDRIIAESVAECS